MIQISLNSAEPIYEQIVQQYKFLVLQKFLKPGDVIPSVRKLALELSITPGTVAKAYQDLERMGMIETIRGKGTFIAESPMPLPSEREVSSMKKKLAAICMELMYMGFEKKYILEMIEEQYDSILTDEKTGEEV